MVELHETLVQAEALRARTSNKDGIPGIPQDVASLQQRAASVAMGGVEGVGVGDQALAKARAFLPSEQLEGMSRLAYSLELRSAFQPQEGPMEVAAGGSRMGGLVPTAPDGAEDLDTFLDRHYQSVITSALDAAADAAEAAAHRAQLRWEAEDWATAKADLRKAREATPGMELLELSLAQAERPEMMQVAAQYDLDPSMALRIARGTSRLTDVQRRYAKALAPSPHSSGSSDREAMPEGEGEEEEEEGLAQRLLTAARGISRASRETVVAEDHEEFRRTLELLGDLLEEERGERHVAALPPHSSREEWSVVLVLRARRHLERDFFSHMQRKVDRARAEGRVVLERQGPLGVAAAFVDLARPASLGSSESDRPYEIIFHLLRGGQLAAAAELAALQSSAGGGPVAREAVEVLEDLLQQGDSSDNPDLQESITAARALAGRREGAAEVWERAVLNLLAYGAVGRMDKAHVVRTTEDYLWWSLWFCSPANPSNTTTPAPSASSSTSSGGRFSVGDLAAKILRWGPAHFDPDGGKRFLYARVLFCCQLFREGVAHLAKSKHMEAVHAALLLSHYHLLADLPSPTAAAAAAAAAGGVGGGAMLEALVLGYIKEFKGTDPQVAADYLLRLRPPERLERGLEALLVELEDSDSRKALAEYLKAKHYAFDYRPEPPATRRPTTQQQQQQQQQPSTETRRYVWDAAQAKATLRRAGAQAEALDARRALELHVLGEDYTRALALLNRQLCVVMVAQSGGERDGWVKAAGEWRAQGLLERVQPETWEGQTLKATFGKLVALCQFFDLCEHGGPQATEQALKIVFDDLRLFPSKVQERSAAKEAFEASPPEFKRVVGQAATRAMQALYNEYRGKRRYTGGAGGRAVDGGLWAAGGDASSSSPYAVAAAAGTEAKLGEIKEKAQALADFAMAVGGDLSNDTLARLNRLQSMMM